VKFGWALITVILGVVGILAILRAGERLAFGGGTDSISIQLLIGLACVIGAWKSFRKARGK
jgi:hypothetical protein